MSHSFHVGPVAGEDPGQDFPHDDQTTPSRHRGLIRGSADNLAPLMVMTPRSGWWSCAPERGAGITVCLGILGALAAYAPRRPAGVTANTRHELCYMGIDEYMATHPRLGHTAHAWVHLGADGASVDSAATIQCSDDENGGSLSGCTAGHGAGIARRVAGDIRPWAKPGRSSTFGGPCAWAWDPVPGSTTRTIAGLARSTRGRPWLGRLLSCASPVG